MKGYTICHGFGKEFKRIRDHYGMTMRQFGKALGISASTCHRYENEIAKRIPEDVYNSLLALAMHPEDTDLLYSFVNEDDSIDEEMLRLQGIIDQLTEENKHLKALLTEKWIKEWEAQNRLYEITKKHMKSIEDYLPEAFGIKE